MTTPAPARAAGVLPNSVIKDRRADGYILFLTLNPTLQAAQLQTWLQGLSALVSQLEAAVDGEPVASCVVAFGPSFFQAGGQPRFGLQSPPADFSALPVIPSVADPAAGAQDIAIYIMSTSEAAVATFERGLVGIQPGTITAASVEHGYQRSDGREQFGFRDGLRNVVSDRREAVIFVDPDNQPEEPSWTDGGSYMAYMKVRQNLDVATQLGQAAMEQIIGRRMSDGSRLDLPEGTDPRTEGVFANPNIPPLASHVRKAGPRDAIHDLTEIFRRGIPYTELQPDGSLDAGLQFISFQCMLDNFNVIFSRWMTNQNFPAQAAGADALFANNLVSIEKAGFYFVPPADPRFIGAGLFDAPVPDPCTLGRVIVHKQVVDQTNQPVLVDLGGFTFQIVDANNQAVGATFQTDSAGHAESPDLQRGQTYTLQEVNPPTGFQTAPNQNFTLTQHRQILQVTDQVQGAPPPYNP